MSAYIEVIPVSAEAGEPAEHSAAMASGARKLTSAIAAKTGVAPRLSQWRSVRSVLALSPPFQATG